MYKVECDADVALVCCLAGVSKKRIMHHSGKNEVLKKLLRGNDSVAMIDKDPSSIQPTHYLQHFQSISFSENNGIEVLHNASGHNRLIILYPRLEEWIVESARRVDINLGDYNLATNGNELHAEINDKINRFEELLDDLKAPSNRIRTLRTRLTEPF